MNPNKLFKLFLFLLVCVFCSFIGGYAAIRFLPANVITTAAIQQGMSDTDWMQVLNNSMNNISEQIRPSIVSVISKGDSIPEVRDEDGSNKDEDSKDKDNKDNKDNKENNKDSNDNSNKDNDNSQIDLGTGSGIILSTDGYILTNYHVIQNADTIAVKLSNNKEIPAKVIGKDSRNDIAVLKVDEKNLIPARFGDSSLIRSGDMTFAIGSPLGLELTNSITMGVISGTNRTLMVDGYRMTLIQTDAAINPGNSGGALVNINGEVIGINTLKEFYAGSFAGLPVGVEGVGFAIPVNTAKPIIDEIIEKGYVKRPGIGVSIINGAIPKDKNVPNGLLVGSVVKDGPADKAGIIPGDLIIEFQGKEVSTFQGFLDEINKHNIGDKVDITVWRENEKITLPLELEQLKE